MEECIKNEIWISQQPLVRSFLSFKLRLIWPNQTFLMFKIYFKWRWPQMEDCLKTWISQQLPLWSGKLTQMGDYLKYQTWNISANFDLISSKFWMYANTYVSSKNILQLNTTPELKSFKLSLMRTILKCQILNVVQTSTTMVIDKFRSVQKIMKPIFKKFCKTDRQTM